VLGWAAAAARGTRRGYRSESSQLWFINRLWHIPPPRAPLRPRWRRRIKLPKLMSSPAPPRISYKSISHSVKSFTYLLFREKMWGLSLHTADFLPKQAGRQENRK